MKVAQGRRYWRIALLTFSYAIVTGWTYFPEIIESAMSLCGLESRGGQTSTPMLVGYAGVVLLSVLVGVVTRSYVLVGYALGAPVIGLLVLPAIV
jgi:4-hydroxybenzoate polyprenyltransferase